MRAIFFILSLASAFELPVAVRPTMDGRRHAGPVAAAPAVRKIGLVPAAVATAVAGSVTLATAPRFAAPLVVAAAIAGNKIRTHQASCADPPVETAIAVEECEVAWFDSIFDFGGAMAAAAADAAAQATAAGMDAIVTNGPDDTK